MNIVQFNKNTIGNKIGLKRFLLVGCGDMGSRHLQGLVKLPFDKTIEVIEPDQNAKNLAESRLNEIEYFKKKLTLKWHTSIKESHQSDVTIISTQSNDRVNVIEELLRLGNSRFLIEKMVCQSTPEYEKILNDFTKFNAKGWVNTNFRYFTFFQNLITYFSKNMPLKFVISGFEKGLGSNAIHFLDLFLWFTNSKNLLW